MLQKWKRKWKKDISQLANGEPGERFISHHRQQQQKRSGKSWKSLLYITMGIVLMVIGILISIPPIGVPGFILTLLGLSLLVSRLKSMAILLDKAELALHRMIKRWKEKREGKVGK